MALFYSDLITPLNAPLGGQPLYNRARVNKLQGRLRIIEAVMTLPAAAVIGDKLIVAKLPLKSRLVGHLSKLQWGAGTAAQTLALGDPQNGARYLAATASNAAGSAVPVAADFQPTFVADVTSGSATLANVKGIGAVLIGSVLTSGTGITANTTVTGIDYVARTITLSAAATATNAAVTVTVTGNSYEVSTDLGNFANGFQTSATIPLDDTTLLLTLAGANSAAAQFIQFRGVFAQD
jgi:hypothetical protein